MKWILFLCSLQLAGLAQGPVSQQFHTDKIPLILSGNSLSVQLNNLGPASNWVVAVRIDSAATPYFTAASGRLVPLQGARVPSEFRQLAPNLVKAGSLSFDFGREPSRGIFIYIAVPAMLKVTLLADQSQISETTVTESLLVRNGVTQPEPVRGMRDVLRSLTSIAQPPTPPIARTPDGHVFVTKEKLRQHLVNAERVPSVRSPNVSRLAFIIVEVSATGSPRVISQRGDPAVSEAATRSIASWKFSPFELEGQAVPVRTTLVFGPDSTGAVGIAW